MRLSVGEGACAQARVVVSEGRRAGLPSGEAMEAGTALGTHLWLERAEGLGCHREDGEDPLLQTLRTRL